MSLTYEFGDFHLDPTQRLLRSRVDGQVVPLTARIFDTLLYLVEHRGEVLDKDTLLKAIWPKTVVEESSLATTIYTLRRALGERPDEHRFIVTVPGRGYRFVAEVNTPKAPATEPQQAEADAAAGAALSPSAEPGARISRRTWAWAVLLAAVIVVAGLAVMLLRPHKESAVASVATSTRPTSLLISAPATSIAVLPFANLTGDPSQDYMGEGIAEELINTLTYVPGLKVPARTSSFAYKSRNKDSREIARELAVTQIVEGSVRSAGARIRVSAQLIDAQTGYHLWEQSFDRRSVDLFKLQDELAIAIVSALQPGFDIARADAIIRPPPTNDVEAYRLWLQGTGLIYPPTEANLHRALELFGQAVERDPKFSKAWLGTARVYAQSIVNGYELPGALAGFTHAAGQASKVAPNSPEDIWALAYVNVAGGNWLEAQSYSGTAFTLLDTPIAHISHASSLLQSVGHGEAALREAQEAYKRAPNDLQVATSLMVLQSIHGHDLEALKLSERIVALGLPERMSVVQAVRSAAARRSRRFKVAASYAAAALPPRLASAGGADVAARVFAALENSSQRSAAISAVARLDALGTADRVDSYIIRAWLLQWYVELGDLDRAYAVAGQWLAQYRSNGWVGLPMPELLWVPELRTFRTDPRFLGFVTGLHYPEFWSQYGPPDGCTFAGEKLTCS